MLTVNPFQPLQTQNDTCANSVDPDNEPSHSGSTLFAILLLIFWQTPLFSTKDMYQFIDGIIHLEAQGLMG